MPTLFSMLEEGSPSGDPDGSLTPLTTM
jgi:hypothetical protein